MNRRLQPLRTGLEKNTKAAKNVLVYDLGGGTFDVSILAIEDGIYEVKASSGDTHLGGEDFDNKLIEDFLAAFKKQHTFSKDEWAVISKDKQVISILKPHAEKAKKLLSNAVQAEIIF